MHAGLFYMQTGLFYMQTGLFYMHTGLFYMPTGLFTATCSCPPLKNSSSRPCDSAGS